MLQALDCFLIVAKLALRLGQTREDIPRVCAGLESSSPRFDGSLGPALPHRGVTQGDLAGGSQVSLPGELHEEMGPARKIAAQNGETSSEFLEIQSTRKIGDNLEQVARGAAVGLEVFGAASLARGLIYHVGPRRDPHHGDQDQGQQQPDDDWKSQNMSHKSEL